MAKYLYECRECRWRVDENFPVGQAPSEFVCPICDGVMGRLFTMPQVIGQPDRLRADNKYWWLKDGQTYSDKDKLEMDRADAKRYETDRAAWAERKKLSEGS
jgi:hypothetical protein